MIQYGYMNSYGIRPIITVLLIAVLAAAVWLMRPILAAMVLAAMVALFMYPAQERLRRIFRISDSISAFLLLLVCIALLIGLAVLATTYLWSEFFVVYSKVFETAHAIGLDNPSSLRLWQDVKEVLRQYRIDDQAFSRTVLFPALNAVNAAVSAFFSNFFERAARILVNIFVFLLTVFFLLRDGKRFIAFVTRLSPLSESETKHIFQTFRYVLEGLIIGNFLTAIAQGIIGGIGFWIFHLPAPIFWGSVMMVASLFPFVGPAVIYAPAALFVYSGAGGFDAALLFLAYNILITSTMDNIIKPMVMGKRANIHPLVIFIALITGVLMWGAIGIIYGPLIAALLLLAIDFYLEETKQRSLFEKTK